MSKFRIDIQVIRGICLISVFIYHYNKEFLNSGFIGVDIFFLLSGYVNSYSYINRKTISFVKYYFHRSIRLLPVSWIVLLVALYITSHENIIYHKKLYLDILSADLSILNYRFIFLSTDYLSRSEKPSIVLHYWSLSVEDQFYLFFPFFIRIVISNISLYTVLLISSYIYSLYECIYYHSYAYFSFLSRIWEFLLGISLLKVRKFKQKNFFSNIILMIIISILFVKNIEAISPSISIIPLSLIVLVLNNDDNRFILSSKLLQHFGNISYCYYLFHYPIIYICTEYLLKLNNIVLCFILTYIMSLLITYYFEKPIRKNIIEINYQVVVIVLLHFSLITCIIYFIRMNKKQISKMKTNKLLYSYNDINVGWKRIWSNASHCPSRDTIISQFKEKIFALLIVDSHVEQWSKIIMPYLISNNYIPLQIYAREYHVIIKDLNVIERVINTFKHINLIIIG